MFGWCWDGYWCWIGPRLKLQRRSQKMDCQVSSLWLPEVDPKITRQCRTDSWLQGWNMSTKFWRSSPLDMRLGWCRHHSHLAVPFLNGAVLTKVGGMQKVRTQFFNAVAFFVPTYSNPFSTGHIACQVGSNLICTQEMGAKFVWEGDPPFFAPPFSSCHVTREKCSSGFRIGFRISSFPGSVTSGSRYMEPGPVYQPSAGRAVSYGAQSMGSSMMGGLLGSATSTLQVQLSIDWNHNGRSEWFMMTMTMTLKNSEWTDDHWWLMNKWWCVTMKPIVCWIMLNLGAILISRLWLYVTT